jgi:multicomponent K+:H+ antiporter subunit G
MTSIAELPDWASLLTAILFLLGATLTLIGTVGLVRFKSFYQRVHAPTLGTTFGTVFVLIGSMVFFSVLQCRPIIHEILIITFVTLTTPITLMLLVRAALSRDLQEGSPEVSTLGDSNIH